MGGDVRIGTSGYQYNHWRGVFYPENLPKDEWFEHYARHFDTVEINNTFYNLPEKSTFESWHARAPKGFRYVLKYNRYATHMKCLKDPGDSLEKFLERAEELKGYLGPVLVQLKPNWGVDCERLRGFLDAAPDRIRWAVEFRDPSWLTSGVFGLLREHGAALVVHDMIDDHPREVTADWVYLRFHGDHYQGSYSPQFLTALARRIRRHRDAGRDVFVFFNNDDSGHAVHNALDLKRYLE